MTHHDPAFTELITIHIPAIARLPRVRAAMQKYTSGYLTPSRLALCVGEGSLPYVVLGPVGGAAGGQQSGDTITIDDLYFKYYKQAHFNYVHRVPITVFHELAHWGYEKGQKSGHPSNSVGRSHDNHGEYKSPLNTALEPAMWEYQSIGWQGAQML